MNTIKVGTRGSRLALTQTNQTISLLKENHPDVNFEVVVIKTKGDLRQDIALNAFGDKGIFVTEIEENLLSGAIDLAIHSLKDMPSDITEGLAFAKAPKRQDPRDVLITKEPIKSILDLPQGAKIGTGSKRRGFQLQALKPDLVIVPIRGNVETRIEKIHIDSLDGVVLAAAGIHRLNLRPEHMIYFTLDEVIPAPAQGALAIQYRKNDTYIKSLLSAISHDETDICIRAERSFLSHIEGSCHVPIGAYASIKGETLSLKTIFGDAKGTWLTYAEDTGSILFPESLGEKCAKTIQSKEDTPGKVYLIGAGPGDTELLTLKAKKLLETCDAVVYDRLSSPDLLSLVPSSATKIYVGKSSNHHTYSQESINQLLIVLSRTHKNIVRLKGGDPYVFGRGGEEGNALNKLEIPFESVPGISSAIAGLNYAGIPITHRDCASSFHVFTGHFKDDQTLDYKTIAKLGGTLVFLMSISSLHKICHGLISEGKLGSTPVAMISKATTSEQRTFVSTLENAKEDLPSDLKYSPALFVVGDVVLERSNLNWFESRPLFGQTALVMRSKTQASKLSKKLKEQGAKVIELPMINTIPTLSLDELKSALLDPSYTHLWFTSENAVRYFMDGVLALGFDCRILGKIQILAIGSATANLLKQYGIKPDHLPVTFTQEGIIELMEDHLKASDHILLPSGNLAREKLSTWAKSICKVTDLSTYNTEAVNYDTHELKSIKNLLESNPVWLPFTSSSSAHNFQKWISDHGITLHPKTKCISIGPLTSQALIDLGFDVLSEAKTHDIEGLVKCILSKNVQ